VERLNDLPGPKSESLITHTKFIEICGAVVLEVVQRPQQVLGLEMKFLCGDGAPQDLPDPVADLSGHSDELHELLGFVWLLEAELVKSLPGLVVCAWGQDRN